ncbi:MAG: DUF2179 domain-containing protein [Candidatus Muiribacteriota bacterium]|jgi:uncharacterized protein YebE (UPF0316 family)
MEEFLASPWYAYGLLPFLIFISRLIDVSLGTLRVIFISKGLRNISAILGFFEVLIWILAIGQILQNLNNALCYIAYAGGFATGNYIGIYAGEKISIGRNIIRVITAKNNIHKLADYLRERKIGFTVMDAVGGQGPVKILFIVTEKQFVEKILEKIKEFNPKAFYTVEDVQNVSEGIFPETTPWYKPSKIRLAFKKK